MKLRILFAGADSDYAIERPYRQYLAMQPEIDTIEFFPAQNIFLEYYQKSLFNKLLYRVGLSCILGKINRQIIESADRFRPDVFLVFKGMEIFPSTLRKLKERGVKLVNYNPDNPFVFSGRGSGNRNVAGSVRLFDLYLSYDSSVSNELKARKVRSGLLPFGFDVSNQLFDKCKDIPEILRLCFIGNADSSRLKFLNELARRGIEIDVFGANWDIRKLHRNISFRGYAGYDELWINLRRYRIQLNLMRIHNADSHNMRSFEIPAIGGIQLAPDTPDHRNYFLPGKEIFLFRNIDDCVAQINKLLSMTSEEARVIRESARNRSLVSGYGYLDRARELFNHISGLYPANVK